MENNQTTEIPTYSRVVYGDLYNNLDKSMANDSLFSANLRTFFQYDKLVEASLLPVKINQSVLQMGLVFGNQIDAVARRVGAYGQYDILDINGLQVSRCQEKYGNIYPALKIFKQDATTIDIKEQYDTVICFMLLQELPPASKAKVINKALSAVKPGGSVVFIDWHQPLFWHPLRYVVRMYNRLRHPFAEKLWDRDIQTFAKNKTAFTWRKSTYFGRMFQRLIVTRKVAPIQEIVNADNNQEKEFYLPDF